MAKPDDNTPYYAISGSSNNGGETTGGKWSKQPENLSVGTIALSGAGEKDTISCEASLQVVLSGNMVDKLQEGDAFITLEGLNGLNATSVDLTSSSSFSTVVGQGDAKTATATFTSSGVELSNSSSSKEITAQVWIVNKKSDTLEGPDKGDQNYLAGKSLTVTIKTQVTNCTTTSAAGD